MIPHVCHLYWGGGPLSYLQYLTIASFKKHNPSWSINLFVPTVGIERLPSWSTGEQEGAYGGKDYLARAKKLCTVVPVDFEELGITKPLHEVQRSDLLRWHILYEQGGLWSDIDILYTQPMDRLMDLGADAALVYHADPFIGFMFGRPGLQPFGDFFNIAKDNVRRNMDDTYQSLGAEMLRYRYGSFGTIQSTYPDIVLANLTMDIVYPYQPGDDVEEMFFGTADKTTGDTFGLHWYNGSAPAKRYQNGDFQANGSIISKLIKDYRV